MPTRSSTSASIIRRIIYHQDIMQYRHWRNVFNHPRWRAKKIDAFYHCNDSCNYPSICSVRHQLQEVTRTNVCQKLVARFISLRQDLVEVQCRDCQLAKSTTIAALVRTRTSTSMSCITSHKPSLHARSIYKLTFFRSQHRNYILLTSPYLVLIWINMED